MADITNVATRPVLCQRENWDSICALPCMPTCSSPRVATQHRTGPRLIVCTTATTPNVEDGHNPCGLRDAHPARGLLVPVPRVLAMRTQTCIGHTSPLDTLESLAKAYCPCSAHARMPFAPAHMRQVAPRCTAVDQGVLTHSVFKGYQSAESGSKRCFMPQSVAIQSAAAERADE